MADKRLIGLTAIGVKCVGYATDSRLGDGALMTFWLHRSLGREYPILEYS